MINKSSVISQPRKKPPWVLTQEAMDHLLTRLHPDRELAGLVYQQLRDKLTVFFECRRCAFPEDLADETLNRIARKILEGELIVDVDRYALTVVRYILLEYQRRSFYPTVSLDNLSPEYDLKIAETVERTDLNEEEEERRKSCMRGCLLSLPSEDRELLIEYYQDVNRSKSNHHKEMARRLGLTPNALYLRIHRLREKLAGCLENCLRQD
jgi:RNA polymerase sigma factor (sigma-70 family)